MTFIDEVNPHGFLSPDAGTQKEFESGTDDYDRFLKNLQIQPSDWVYRNLPVIYKYNKLGFRCVEHTSLDKPYILFTGCSLTVGIGLPLEKTYPYLVSQKLNMPYYNLAVGGSGPDVARSNLLLFLSLMINNLPKFVVVQWPSFLRYSLIKDDFQTEDYNPHTGHKEFYKELLTGNKLTATNVFYRYHTLKFLENLNLKTIQFSDEGSPWFKNQFTNVVKMNWPGIDKARDLCHPGIKDHEIVSEEIFNKINSY